MGDERLSPQVRKLIAAEMAVGQYRSKDALLVEALHALADRRAAIAGIRQGLEDIKAGRQSTRKASTRRLLKRHPFLAD